MIPNIIFALKHKEFLKISITPKRLKSLSKLADLDALAL
jgi:hypothetical protein